MPVVNLLHEFLLRSAERRPDRAALIFGGEELSYRELHLRSACLATYLHEHGLTRGDRVVIYLENSLESVVSLFGTLMAGGVFSVVNPSIKANKLLYIVKNCVPSFIITDKTRRPMVDELKNRVELPEVIVMGQPGDDSALVDQAVSDIDVYDEGAAPEVRQIDLDLAAIIYTSGSTGDPKGVTLTHRNMVTAANAITGYLENVESDIILSVLPLSFDYGLYQVLMTALFGGTLVLKQRFGYPFQLVQEIQERQVTGLPCVPTMMAILLKMEKLQQVDLSCVRYISNTGAALPPSYFPRLKKVFPGARIYSMYGLTECKRVSYLPPDMVEEKPESVGIPMPNTEVYVIDEAGRPHQRNAAGELIVRGSNVMQGYYNDAEATAQVLRPGRYPGEKVLHTGDQFRIDNDGFLYFLGRMDDLIKSRGERVSPREIENVLYELEDIEAVRISPVPDEVMGNAIKAEVVLSEGSSLTLDDITRHCRTNLEELFVPKYIEIVASLPKSPSGKIKRSS